MKKIFFTITLILSFLIGFCQAPNQSDGGTPPDVPPDDDPTDTCEGVIFNPNTHKCDCMCGVIGINDICTIVPTISLICPDTICTNNEDIIGFIIGPTGGSLSAGVSSNLQ